MRTGVVAKKLGMTRYLDDNGRHIPVTVLALDDCRVVGVRTEDRDGYVAVQVGSGPAKTKRVNKAQRVAFGKRKVEPAKRINEFRVAPDALLQVGARIRADHFVPWQFVDVSGVSKGKGFAGAMKRHGFRGLRATHGVSVSHRSHGSTGQCQDPGKVFKGKKMAGHMGAKRVTQQSLEVVAVDTEKGLILVKGSVPGAKQEWILVRDAVKVSANVELPYPAKLQEDAKPETKSQGADAVQVAQEETVAEAPQADAAQNTNEES